MSPALSLHPLLDVRALLPGRFPCEASRPALRLINYEICLRFTELQSNQSTLSGEELERGSTSDCGKPEVSTGLLNLSPWPPKRPVSSEWVEGDTLWRALESLGRALSKCL